MNRNTMHFLRFGGRPFFLLIVGLLLINTPHVLYAQEETTAPQGPIYKVVPLVSPSQLMLPPEQKNKFVDKPRTIPQYAMASIGALDTAYMANLIYLGGETALDYNTYKPEHEKKVALILQEAGNTDEYLLALLPWPIRTDRHSLDVYRYRKTLQLFFQKNPQVAEGHLKKLQEMVPTLQAIAEILFRKQVEAGHFIHIN